MEASSNDNYYEVCHLLCQTTVESDVYADDIEAEMAKEYEVHRDGCRTRHYITRYERNSKNIRQVIVIKTHGTKCMSCGFVFETTYGEHRKGYIEVHQVVCCSSEGEEVSIDPATALDVVCPNCYRMI